MERPEEKKPEGKPEENEKSARIGQVRCGWHLGAPEPKPEEPVDTKERP